MKRATWATWAVIATVGCGSGTGGDDASADAGAVVATTADYTRTQFRLAGTTTYVDGHGRVTTATPNGLVVWFEQQGGSRIALDAGEVVATTGGQCRLLGTVGTDGRVTLDAAQPCQGLPGGGVSLTSGTASLARDAAGSLQLTLALAFDVSGEAQPTGTSFVSQSEALSGPSGQYCDPTTSDNC